jgi:hypothetical protein
MQYRLSFLAIALSLSSTTIAQVPQPAPDETSPHGTVLFNRNEDSPAAEKKAQSPAIQKLATLSDAERSSLTFTAYDLDVHLIPAKSQLAVRAAFTVRNSGTQPLSRLAFQISSSLHWEGFALRNAERLQPVPFGEHFIDTDADHTGQAKEAIVSLPQPLAPGSTVEFTAFYSGEIMESGKRLERIGAPATQATQADWDKIATEATALRGFGNVLWYPTATAPALLGDGAKLFQSVGQTKLQQSAATIRLRLTVEYVGDPPKAAYFCGHREQLLSVSENINALVADAPGVATAEFSARPLGFRTPSLFVTDTAMTATSDNLVSAVTSRDDALPAYGAAATKVQPLLADWLGPTPLTTLNILDNDGQPFEDDAFLVTSMRVADTSVLAPVLVHSLAHAWFSSSHEWLNEGVPHFMSLLWTEQSEGRDTAIRQLHEQVNTLALAEPDLSKSDQTTQVGQSLIEARDEVYYRTKAAAVLWMLRSVVGDEPLKRALQLYRRSGKRDEDPNEFQRVLEQTTKKDLRWFFDDWVYRDRGLPDLSIANVTPRELPAQGGKAAGWLIAVEVRNDGDAIADVPVVVRSGILTASGRIRVAGRSSASTRILFEGTPDEVVVNDGSVPEIGAISHRKQLVAH